MSKAALLVIDAQVGIIEGPAAGPVFKKEEVIQNIKKVINHAREHKIPVIYIQDLEVGADDTDQKSIHPELSPQAQDLIVSKLSTDAFFRTNLQSKLEELEVKHLVLTGVKTEYCVDTTARSAISRGFDVTLVSDGHSTTDNKVLKAEQIIAHHNCNLHGLDNIDFFILVRSSDEDIFVYKHLEYK
jgi:nicotinamidase-related amidase